MIGEPTAKQTAQATAKGSASPNHAPREAFRSSHWAALIARGRGYIEARDWAELLRLWHAYPGVLIPQLDYLAGPLNKRSLEALQQVSVALYAENRLQESEARCLEMLTIDRHHIETRLLLGKIYQRRQRWKELLVHSRELAKLAPSNAEVHIQRADALLQLDDASNAEAECELALQIDPGSSEARHLLGRIRASVGDWAGVASALGEHPENGRGDGDRVDVQIQFGAACAEEGRWDDALRALSQAAFLGAAGIDALEDLGCLLSRQGDRERASEAFRNVVDLDQSRIASLSRLAEIYSSESKWADALLLWTAAHELDPADPLYLQHRCALLYKLARFDEAEEACLQLLESVPDDFKALKLLGRVRYRQERWEEVIDIWSQIATRHPDNIEARQHVAIALYKSRRFTEAEAEYRAILAHEPDNARALTMLGRIFRNTNRLEQAIAVWEQLAASGNLEPLEELANANYKLDRLSDAMTCCTRILELDPKHTRANRIIGSALHRQEDWARSLPYWETLCQISAEPEPWHRRVHALTNLGRIEEASEVLEMAKTRLSGAAGHLYLARMAGSLRRQDDAEAHLLSALDCERNVDTLLALGNHYLRTGIADAAFFALVEAREHDPDNAEVIDQLSSVLDLLATVEVDCLDLRRRPATGGDLLTPECLLEVIPAKCALRPMLRHNPGRITLVTSSLGPGGAERQVVNTIRGLLDSGMQGVSLLCRSLSDSDTSDFFLHHLEDLPVEVVEFAPPGMAEGQDEPRPPHAEILSSFPPQMRRSILPLFSHLQRLKPEVVHAWQDSTSIDAAVAAALAGVPRIVLSSRSLRPDAPRRLRRHLVPGYRSLLRLPNITLINNSHAGALDYADWIGIEPDSIKVVPNGFDFATMQSCLDDGAAEIHRQSMQLRKDQPLVGGILRMTEEKGPLLWVETAARVAAQRPDVRFVLLGDGPMRGEVESLAKERGISDRLHAPGNVENVFPWLSLMDILLSTSRVEGLPNVLVEAQWAGVPIVAPDVGGMGEAMRSAETGWLVADRSSDALADRILWTLANPEWRRAAGQRAKEFIETEFSIASMIERTISAYGLEGRTHEDLDSTRAYIRNGTDGR